MLRPAPKVFETLDSPALCSAKCESAGARYWRHARWLIFLLISWSLCFPLAPAQSRAVHAPDLNQLQQQIIELSRRLDRTSFLITAVLLLFMALACFGLWWNARSFRAFRSVGLYLASVSCVFFVDYLPQTSSWEPTFFALTTLLWPEMAADALNIPKGRWIWLNRVPCMAALLLGWSLLRQPMYRITFDWSELMVAVLLVIAFRRGNPSDRLIRTALTLLWFTHVSLNPFVRRFVPTQFRLWGWHWNYGPLAMVLFGAIAIALFARELISDRQEKQRLAAELEAGRAMQQVLLGSGTPNVLGLLTESVYKPASEVGGDFFHLLPTLDGGLLMAIGDVSGKGLRAAMTVSTILGSLRALPVSSPAEVLRALNSTLGGKLQGSMVTCLAMQIAADGTVTLANAGHLPPYRNGEELRIDAGLPLGVVPDVRYTETVLRLAFGDLLTLLTDGVVEARNAQGELFGFERTAAISTQSAESIAQAAQRHGQEDDITVLTLTFSPVGVVNA